MDNKLENLLRLMKENSELGSANSVAPGGFEQSVLSQIKQRKSVSVIDRSLESAHGFMWQLCAASLVLTFGIQAYLGSVADHSTVADVYSATFTTADADYLMGSN